MTGAIKRTFKDVTRFFCNYSWLLKCTVFFVSLIKVFYHIGTNFTFFIWADNHITMQSSLFPCSTLREKSLNTEFFLVRIFTHLDWTRRDTPYLSVWTIFLFSVSETSLCLYIYIYIYINIYIYILDDKGKCRNVKNKMFFICLPEKM